MQQAGPGQMVVLIGAPCLPFGPALGARQLDMRRLLCVQASDAPALLWATREALQCADVASVLAWLPDARSAHLRRLQIAAHAHNKLLFVFRPLRAQQESSPAPLRLLLQGTPSEAGNLLVHVLKRRGPPLAAPLLLATRPARLLALLAASRERVRRRREESEKEAAPVLLPATSSVSSAFPWRPHALDRIASLHTH
jgi:protein ImuA